MVKHEGLKENMWESEDHTLKPIFTFQHLSFIFGVFLFFFFAHILMIMIHLPVCTEECLSFFPSLFLCTCNVLVFFIWIFWSPWFAFFFSFFYINFVSFISYLLFFHNFPIVFQNYLSVGVIFPYVSQKTENNILSQRVNYAIMFQDRERLHFD